MSRGQYDSNDGFWVFLFGSILVLLVWNVAKPYAHFISLTSGYYQARTVETAAKYIPLVEVPQVTEDRRQLARTLNRGPHNLGKGDIFSAKRSTQRIFLSIVTVWFSYWGYLIWTRRPNPFTGMLSLDKLDVFISRFYYPSRSVVGRQLHLRHPLKDRTRRFARKPWEWAVEIGTVRHNGQPIALKYKKHSINAVRPSAETLKQIKFHEPTARTALLKQLGQKIARPEDVLGLRPEYRALLVALLADVVPSFGDRFGVPDKWLKQFSTGFWDLKALQKGASPSELPPVDREHLDSSGCQEALEWFLAQADMRDMLKASGFANALMVHLMKKSTLATAKFVWLKVINRPLFYALNNVGRPRRIYIEGHAAIVHAEYEDVCGGAQSAPFLNHSIEAIRQSLQANHWIPTK